MMRHVKVVSCARPAVAQVEQLIQIVGLLNALIGLFQNVLRFADDLREHLKGGEA